MYAPLYYSTVQVGPRFGDLHSLQYHGWGWYPTQTQTTSTSILDILSYNMFEPLACCLKAIWVHPYAVTPNKLALDLGILGHLLLGNDVTMSWLRLMSTSDCFPPANLCIQSVWAIGMLSQGRMGEPLMLLQRPSCPRFGNSGSLVEWKWCHRVMVEAGIHLRLLQTYIFDIFKVFEPLVCCLKAIRVHPYTVTLVKLAPDLGIQIHLWSENVAIVSCFRLISTSDLFKHPMDTSKVFNSLVCWVSRAYGCTLIFILPACQVGPGFGNSDSLLVEWKWCHNIMVEADIHLRPPHWTL